VSKKPKVDPASPFAKLAGVKDKLEAEEKAREAEKREARRPAQATGIPLATKAAFRAPSDGGDDLSFARLMMGVTPIADGTRRIGKTNDTAPKATPEQASIARKTKEELEAEEAHAHLRALAFGAARFEIEDDGVRVEGRRADLAGTVLRRLRRGLYPLDSKLDLHGMGAEEAKGAIGAWLGKLRGRNDRCGLVVHGKGVHSPGGKGVLRGEIAAWLSQGPASEHVAAFCTATEEDGGVGATYVLLRF